MRAGAGQSHLGIRPAMAGALSLAALSALLPGSSLAATRGQLDGPPSDSTSTGTGEAEEPPNPAAEDEVAPPLSDGLVEPPTDSAAGEQPAADEQTPPDAPPETAAETGATAPSVDASTAPTTTDKGKRSKRGKRGKRGKQAAPADPAEAEIDADLQGLLEEEVVASASRKAESSSDAPATTEVITASDLRRFGIRTMDEAFTYLSLGMSHSQTGGTGAVGARGLSIAADLGSHVLLLLDGHVVNEPGAGASWYDTLGGMPIEMIDRIEIIYGPGSVLYGNNAMLAVVSIFTKKGSSIDGVQITGEHGWSPNQNRYGNLGNYRPDRAGRRDRIGLLYGRGFRVLGRDGDFMISGEYLGERGAKMHHGAQYIPELIDIFDFGPNTGSGDPRIWGGYSGKNVRGPYGYMKLGIGNFTLMARGAWLTDTSPESALEFGSKNGLSNQNSHVEGRYDYQIRRKVSGLARVYGDHYLFRNELDFPAPVFCGALTAPCMFHVAAEAMRIGAENQWRFDWFGDGRYETTVGADGQIRQNRGSFLTDNSVGEVEVTQPAYRVVESTIGVYAQQIARFHPRVRMNLGLRYDRFAYAQAFSPRAALITSPWKNGELKLIYSQAFRAPSRVELQFNDNPLRPEIVRGGELALQQRIGRHRLMISAWGSFWDTIIQRTFETDPANPGRTEVKQRNVNQIFGVGGTAGYSANFGRFDYGLHVSYGYNRVRLGGFGNDAFAPTDQSLLDSGYSRQAYDAYGRNQPLAVAPSVTGNLQLAYQWGERGPSTAFVMGVIGPRIIDRVYNSPNLLGLVDEGVRTTLPTTVQGRFIVSGDIAYLKQVTFGYRFAVDAISNTHSVSAVGPFGFYQVGDGTRQLDLLQVPRLTVFGGLDVRFGGVARREQRGAGK